jgi:protein-L-isoaspartate(D-aspartate) O-methyltransferase
MTRRRTQDGPGDYGLKRQAPSPEGRHVTTDADVCAPTADELRRRLVETLTAQDAITSDAVARAMLTVPREVFAPAGTDLAEVYGSHVAIVTKRGADGRAMSSISAPWLQACMLEQSRIGPGRRVLEIGSGGYNAALLTEIAGPAGSVVSLDIDPQVVGNARAALDGAGYRQVQTVHGDGEYGFAAGGPYDVILVTVEASDIPPAWIEQLAPGGVLVAPLRMRANTRSVALEREGDHLKASSSLQCGFVPMQGDGRDPMLRLPLRGQDAVLVLDDPASEVDAGALSAALDGQRHEAWSTVCLPMDAAFDALHLWIASQPRPYGVFNVDRERTLGLLDPQDKFFCPTLLTRDSLAYLTVRRHDDSTWQCGAHAFGPDAGVLAEDLVELVTAWDVAQRAGSRPQMSVYPAGSALPDAEGLRLVVRRRHTRIVISWTSGGSRPT